jgi:hypothetical protein
MPRAADPQTTGSSRVISLNARPCARRIEPEDKLSDLLLRSGFTSQLSQRHTRIASVELIESHAKWQATSQRIVFSRLRSLSTLLSDAASVRGKATE